MSHDYVSTACLHEDEDPSLHSACRKTCKFCDAPCQCAHHAHGGVPAAEQNWVDQARDLAREAVFLLRELHVMPDSLSATIASDPRLFWLRGEEAPPGEWRPS